nr:NPP1 family protein [Paenibacillus turpanensis]
MLQLAQAYSPYLYFDKNEPFFPARVGVSVLTAPGPSPSFPRSFSFEQEELQAIVEYAIYWDWDIGHLYDLEHVWVYIGQDGDVLDCEASFHGKYLKGLRKDENSIADGTHPKLFSQPGKHAFSPYLEVFEVIPDLFAACSEEQAGKDGLTVGYPFRSEYATNAQIHEWCKGYMQRFAFVPSMEFMEYQIPKELFVPWEELKREIPQRLTAVLESQGLSLPRPVEHKENEMVSTRLQ